MVHTPQIYSARVPDGYDFSSSFRYCSHFYNDADYTIANLETTLSHDGSYSGYPAFSSPKEIAVSAKECGVDFFALANNHCLDRLSRGVRNTLSTLDSLGISHVGVRLREDEESSNVSHINVRGVRVGILNYTDSTNGIPTPDGVFVNRLDSIQILNDLQYLGEDDIRIAILHWGVEYSKRPGKFQRDISEFLHRNGVQVVIGSHPHVVQSGYSSLSEATLYSLGNYVSNQRFPDTNGGLLAVVTLRKEYEWENFRISTRIYPVVVETRTYKVVPCCECDTLDVHPLTKKEAMEYRNGVYSLFGVR